MNAAHEDAVADKSKDSDETKDLMLENVWDARSNTKKTVYEK